MTHPASECFPNKTLSAIRGISYLMTTYKIPISLSENLEMGSVGLGKKSFLCALRFSAWALKIKMTKEVNRRKVYETGTWDLAKKK